MLTLQLHHEYLFRKYPDNGLALCLHSPEINLALECYWLKFRIRAGSRARSNLNELSGHFEDEKTDAY